MTARHYHRLPGLERLENRQVLAAFGPTLAEGVLTIEGTNKSDWIVVGLGGEFSDQLSVQFNKTQTFFNLADVTELRINAGGGNDKLWISEGVLLGATIDGGRGNDWLRGGGGNDVILAGAGNDHVYGGGGDDVVVGDAGNDKLWGGAGNDELEGGAGNDWARGDEGDDVLTGGDGHDHLFGGAGVDEAWGGNGHDHLHGGDDNDVLHGEAGKDHVRGGAGDDELFGEDGNDHVHGQDGNDWIDGGSGKDKLWGGLGDDSIKGGWGNDHLNGGAGVNLLDGDEGVNKLWNGTEYDFENPPPPPPEPPQVPQYITYLQSEGGIQGQLVYTKTPLGEGFEEVLEIDVNNGPNDVLSIVIGGRVLGLLFTDAEGHGYAKFSSVPDQPDERAFPLNFVLVEAAEVSIGPELSGVLNLTVPA